MDMFKLKQYGYDSYSITSASQLSNICKQIENEENRKLIEKQKEEQRHNEAIEIERKNLELAEKSIKLAEDSNFISKKANTKSNIANWIAFISMIIALIALFK